MYSGTDKNIAQEEGCIDSSYDFNQSYDDETQQLCSVHRPI